jgi:hypothetical protein
MRTAIAVGAVLALAACSGGNLSSPPATVGGIFTGKLTEGANTYGLSGIIDENGVARFVEFTGSAASNDLSYVAVFTPGSDIPVHGGSSLSIPFTEFSIDGQALDNGQSSETGSLTVDYVLRSDIQGTFSDAHGASGTLDLSFELAYNTAASGSVIAGTYSFTYSSGGNSYLASILIGADGSISGSDNNSCIYSGSFTVPNASYNAYELSITVSGCANAPGTLTGLGSFFPATSSQPNTIDAILSNSSGAAYLVLGRVSS